VAAALSHEQAYSVITNRLNTEHYAWGDGCDGWRLLNREDLSVTQERMPAGTSETRHYHHRARQLFFVLDGRLEIELGGEVFALARTDALEVPPGQPHQVRNVSDAAAWFLVVSAPSTVRDRVNLEE